MRLIWGGSPQTLQRGSVQRPADLTRFRWADYDGTNLRVVQSKAGVALSLPCRSKLRAALDRAEPDPCAPVKTILRNMHGQPMTYHGMAAMMRLERHRPGLFTHDLHALRYRGVMELAWSDCTDSEMSAYSAHASVAMVRKKRRRGLADNAGTGGAHEAPVTLKLRRFDMESDTRTS